MLAGLPSAVTTGTAGMVVSWASSVACVVPTVPAVSTAPVVSAVSGTSVCGAVCVTATAGSVGMLNR